MKTKQTPKPKPEVDYLVIAQVLAAVGINRSDPSFKEIIAFLQLRYLHYQRLALINQMSPELFDRKIASVLVADLRVQLASAFEPSPKVAAVLNKQMQGRYHFAPEATPEEDEAAEQMIQALPPFDQGVLLLFHDGLTQVEISIAMRLSARDVAEVSKEVRSIYRQARIDVRLAKRQNGYQAGGQ